MWQIVWLNISGLLIASLVIRLILDTKWFAPWREGGKCSSTGSPSKGPRPPKPHTSDDCPVCRHKLSRIATEEVTNTAEPAAPIPYAQNRRPRGRKKWLPTAGIACANPHCAYFGVTEEAVHALVHCGSHGLHERVADLEYQTCGGKFSVRYGNAL